MVSHSGAPSPSDARHAPATIPVDGVPASEAIGKAEPAYTAFTRRQKLLVLALASLAATFSGFASNIYFPAIPTMAAALQTTVENINLSVTSYMVCQAIAPTFWAVLSDVYGRRLTLLCCLSVFLSACIGLALIDDLAQLIVLRCLQSFGSASTIAIGAGIVGDVTTREERGGYLGVFQTGLLLPLAIGPVLGGIFAETLGWRAIFWFLVIYVGVFLVILFLLFPETLRALVGNGSTTPPLASRAPLEPYVASRDPSQRAAFSFKSAKLDLLAPLRILCLPEVAFVLVFLSIHYAAWQMAVTAQSSLFASTYGISEISIGLTFIANGAGCMIGTLTTGRFLDRDYARFKARFTGTDFPIEHARLRTVWLWSPLEWGALLLFGWTLDRGVHIAAPIAATFGLSWTAMSTQSIINTYLVDVFPRSSASATAALNLARCLVGAGATAAVDPTIQAMGVGWTFTLWTGLCAVSLGLVGVEMRYGGGWRRRREGKEMH
ncbi:hypothetical protein Q5752_005868 [Cryptotrichosporon argae]